MDPKILLILTTTVLFTSPLKANTAEKTLDRQQRIVNGLRANVDQARFIASLQIRSNNLTEHFCTGSYIGRGWVISASHCVKAIKPCDVEVEVGVVEIGNENDDGSQRFKVDAFCKKKFEMYSYRDDVALLKLDFSSIDITQKRFIERSKIKLFHDYDVEVDNCKIFGFGATQFGESYSNQLLVGAVQLLTSQQCQQILGSVMTPEYSQGLFCASGYRGVDACGGDSGGPLVCESRNKTYLLGLVSYGVGCGSTAGVYTNLIHHFDWIQRVTGVK